MSKTRRPRGKSLKCVRLDLTKPYVCSPGGPVFARVRGYGPLRNGTRPLPAGVPGHSP